ncbi:MAG: sensor histidine kinase [Anaerolineae bacterium]|nr:sensor histidine kinase [Anaerolineae bacterium]
MGRPIEPGLVRVFRYFAVVAAVYFAANTVYTSAETGEIINLRQARAQISMLAYLFLAAYLSWPWLERRLKRFYLPIALAIATVAPTVSGLAAAGGTGAPVSSPADVGLWSVFPVLFIPLVLIAWQYSFTGVIGFTVGAALVDVLLILRLVGSVSLETLPVFASALLRAFAFGIVGHIVSQLMDTQRAQRRILMHANVQLSRHAATLEDLAVSQERNRLARELHDTLAHTLAGLAVNLEALRLMVPEDMAEVRRMLDRSLENTRGGLTDTRRALKALRSQALEDLGLRMAVQNLAQDAAARAGLSLHLDLPNEPLELTPDVDQCVYRIAQEALENVVHHARATRVGVSLGLDHSLLRLTVSDDGLGFSSAGAEGEDRYGIRGMEERAKMVGGRLEVQTVPQQGTSVTLTLRTRDDSSSDL